MGPRINDRIRVREIRVVDEDGGQLGIMTPREALDIARSRGLDLIEVAPDAQPPVCRILDYGKYKFEQGKREREAAKKQRQSQMKDITLRPGTDDHDLDIKIKNIIRFLQDGDKVKVVVRFKSRELAHPEFARRNLDRIVEGVTADGVGIVERMPLTEGKQMIMILAPATTASGAPAKKPAAPKPPKPVGQTEGADAPNTPLAEALQSVVTTPSESATAASVPASVLESAAPKAEESQSAA